MKKTVVIHQPDFLPYLGFFHRLLKADLYLILDDVQFLRRGWHHRDEIKTANGKTWITLGIQKCERSTCINEVKLNDESWRDRHLNLIKQNYSKAPFFEEIFPLIEDLYSLKTDNLVEFNMHSIEILLKAFDIQIEMDWAHKYQVNTTSNQRLVDLLQEVKATHYLSGVGARDYYDSSPFEEANIAVEWQDFTHPTYPQLFGEFTGYLSSIDLLMNCGVTESRRILRTC